MVDLQNQYFKIKNEVDNAVLNVFESAAFINGSEVHSFQAELEEYLNVKNVIPCANGTDALQVALMALDYFCSYCRSHSSFKAKSSFSRCKL